MTKVRRTSSNFVASAGYFITPEVLIGVGLSGFRDTTEISGFSDQIENGIGYEVYGQYQATQYAGAIRVSKFDTDADNTTTRVYGEYEITPTIGVDAVIRSDSEFDGTGYRLSGAYEDGAIDGRLYYANNTDSEEALLGLRGGYAVTPDIRVSAAYSTILGIDEDVAFYSAGGGVRITDGLWVNATIGQFSEDASTGGDPSTRINFNITYELGEQVRVDRRFLQDLIDDNIAGLRF